MANRPNIRRIKIHRTYTVEELAKQTSTHKATVRRWIAQGMPVVDDRRPLIVAGHEAKRFLTERRASRKRACAPDEFYCFKCREARRPVEGMVDRVSTVGHSVNLQGLCPVCATVMHKRFSSRRLDAIEKALDVRCIEPSYQQASEIVGRGA